jgi:hypothetical protein
MTDESPRSGFALSGGLMVESGSPSASAYGGSGDVGFGRKRSSWYLDGRHLGKGATSARLSAWS